MDFKWITTNDLKLWSETNSKESQQECPTLVKKLIYASYGNNEIKYSRFPSGDSVQYSGLDGFVEVENNKKYIPKGISIWEIGTNKNVKLKLESDYSKRSEQDLGIDKSNSTFIFVTPRLFTTKNDWINEKKKDGIWKDIKIYDACDLEEWLELFPVISKWLKGMIHKLQIDNFLSINEFWDKFVGETEFEITSNMILAGREKEEKLIKIWIENDKPFLNIIGESKEEAILSFIAVVKKLESDKKDNIISKTLIVKSEEDWDLTSKHLKNHYLITYYDFTSPITNSNNKQLFTFGKEYKGSIDKGIELSFINRGKISEELRNIQIDSNKKYELEREMKGSIFRLIRLSSKNQLLKESDWIKKPNLVELLPALLVGCWNDENVKDKEIIEKISNEKYSEYINKLLNWTYEVDPPIKKINSIWKITNYKELWYKLHNKIDSSKFEIFIEQFEEIMKVTNPKFELEEGKQQFWQLYNKTTDFSSNLKNEMLKSITTLVCINDSYQLKIDYSIKNIIKNIDSKQKLQTFIENFEILSEISPDIVVDFILNNRDNEDFLSLFKPVDSFYGGDKSYMSILWGIEKLVWNEEYFSDCVNILFELVDCFTIDYNNNNPMRSLENIFNLYWPQTIVEYKFRLAAIESFFKKDAQKAWRLVTNILPKPHAVLFPNSSPIYREWGLEKREYHNNKEILIQTERIIELKCNNIFNVECCFDLISDYSNLPNNLKDLVLSSIYSYTKNLSEDKLQLLKVEIEQEINRHIRFKNTYWAIKGNYLDKLTELKDHIIIEDIILKNLWLFQNSEYNLFQDEENWEVSRSKAKKLRCEALVEIANKDRSLIFDLIKKSDSSSLFHIGYYCGELFFDNIDKEFILKLLDLKKYRVIHGFVRYFVSEKGVSIIVNFLNNTALLSNENKVMLLQYEDITSELLDFLSLNIEIEKLYFELQAEFRTNESKVAIKLIEKLMYYKHYVKAINFIYHECYRNKDIPSNLIVLALEGYLTSQKKTISSYNFGELFKYVYNKNDYDKNKLMILEWNYLKIFRYIDVNPEILNKEIITNPEFFIEILKMGFRDDDGNYFKKLDNNIQIYLNIKEFFDIWKFNINLNDSIEQNTLLSWLEYVTKFSKDHNYTKSVYTIIGQMLSKSPKGSDEVWPHEVIRDVLEKYYCKELFDGILHGKIYPNGIRVSHKNIYDAGNEERAIAEEYKNNSLKINPLHSKTKKLLKKLAEFYEKESNLEYAQLEHWGD
ncbi:hypothetical protein [Haliovirga abyssi]|uniref:Uncharacterized protein n=1 Tax=Haliovirga abyssi TaxID=2996794 RepID=A0AAU9DFQ2_9FUSO|nr:hypothetical protein [Haliovirga abyssi]BDU51038.1 hypothetical protein HLVA_16070 [Haliovirga abyssi]